MAKTWFKFHHSILEDLEGFTSHEKWAWVGLMCIGSKASNRWIVKGHVDDLASYLEFDSIQDFLAYQKKLVERGMLEVLSDGGLRIVKQDKTGEEISSTRLPIALWRKLREQIFERDNYTCQYCGDRGVSLHCDHIMPISRGGSNEPANLQTACKPCNLSKHSKTLEEWIGGAL